MDRTFDCYRDAHDDKVWQDLVDVAEACGEHPQRLVEFFIWSAEHRIPETLFERALRRGWDEARGDRRRLMLPGDNRGGFLIYGVDDPHAVVKELLGNMGRT
jgi:hypothetical protein